MSHLNTHDWAALSRAYRASRGLKQEAMAQDFFVTQSTISRWEAGEREPPAHVKAQLLDSQNAQTQSPSGLLNSAQLCAWDHRGRMHSLSSTLLTRMRNATKRPGLTNRSAARVLRGHTPLRRAFDLLRTSGVFDGRMTTAILRSAPFWDRPAHNGTLTLALSPMQMARGTMLLATCNYEPLQPGPDRPNLAVLDTAATQGVGLNYHMLA